MLRALTLFNCQENRPDPNCLLLTTTEIRHSPPSTRIWGVYLPDALGRKYPNAPKDWGWQYVFPSSKLSVDPRQHL